MSAQIPEHMYMGDYERKRELFPEGTHLAICYSIIHLGAQKSKYGTWQDQMVVSFEFPNELIDCREDDGSIIKKPRVKSEWCFLGSKRNKQFFQSWSGSGIKDKKVFDYFSFLGKPAQIQVIHEKNKAGELCDNISTITPVMKGMPIPELYNTPVKYCHNKDGQFWPQPFPDGVPEWLQDKIKKSAEWIDQETRGTKPRMPQTTTQQQPATGYASEPAQQARQDAPNMFEKMLEKQRAQQAQEAQEVPAQVTETPPEPTPAVVDETPKDDYDPGF